MDFRNALLEHFGKKGIITKTIIRIALVMLLFTICRIAFYGYNSDLFPQMTFGKFCYLLWGGVKFDLSAILYTNLLYLIFVLLPSPIRVNALAQRILFWLFVVSNALILFLNCFDMTFYPFSLRRSTMRFVREFQNEGNLFAIFSKGFTDHYLITILFFLMLYGLIKLYGKREYTKRTSDWKSHYLIGSLSLALSGVLILGGLRGSFSGSTRPITLSNSAKYVEFPREMNIVLNTAFAIYQTIPIKDYQEKKYFDQETLEQVYTPVHPAPAEPGNFKYDNVVIFILESFGKEFSGKLNPHIDSGRYEGYTPFFDSLIAKSKTSWHTFANGKKSIDAMPSILAGIPSTRTPYVLSHYSGNKIDGLANYLNEKGYETGFFHGAHTGSMGFYSFANLTGFDHYYGKEDYNNDNDFDGFWGIWDDKFFDYYANTINELKPPFMTALFSVSSHHPFNVPDDFKGKVKEGPTELHKCINYTDTALKLFFEKAKKMPWYNNTLFVITADHTPSYPHIFEYKTAQGLFKVPIIFYHPQHPEWGDEIENNIFQQIDITPSVLGYLNYDKPYFGYGRNIFDSTTVPFAVNHQGDIYQYFYNDHLVQYNDNSEKAVGLYEFRKDNYMVNNVLEQQPEKKQALETRVRAFIQQYNYRILNNKMSVREDLPTGN